jgi:hypothetical protein
MYPTIPTINNNQSLQRLFHFGFFNIKAGQFDYLLQSRKFNIICTIFMFQRDDFTLSVLTGNQPCQFVLVKKELMKLICEHFCPCYAVPMQHDKCVSATTTRPTSP